LCPSHDIDDAIDALLTRSEDRNDYIRQLDRADASGIRDTGSAIDQNIIVSLCPLLSTMLKKVTSVAGHKEFGPIEVQNPFGVRLVLMPASQQLKQSSFGVAHYLNRVLP
jgi:hypothetical protein